MAQDTDELRARIDEQRLAITETVEQIENRVVPGRIIARRRDRVRRTLTDWKDSVLGNDEPEYPDTWFRTGTTAAPGRQGIVDRASEATSHAVDSARHAVQGGVHEAPRMIRRQARGNPLAAGAVAIGAGWLVASMLPRTEQEQSLARRVEPKLAAAAGAVAGEGQALAEEMREPAHDAVEEIRHAGEDAAGAVRADVRSS